MSYDDELKMDYITVPGQNYALVSFVSPEGPQKNEKLGMKLRGVFATKGEADTHARILQKNDPLCDIFLLEMYKWCCIPPDRNMIEDEVYQEEFLQNLMKEYKENRREARRHFEARKDALVKGGCTTEDWDSGQNAKYYNKEEAPVSVHPSELLEKIKDENPDMTQEELVGEASRKAAELNKSEAGPSEAGPSSD